MEHRKMAVQLFNGTWDLLDKKTRSETEDNLMIHQAHASLYHWYQVGTPLHFQRGEWLLSRVYSMLERFEPAIYHATRCLELTEEHDIKDFDRTFAYEALARANAKTNPAEAKRYLDLARESLEGIRKKDDRIYAESELDAIEID